MFVSSVEPLVPDGAAVEDRRILGSWEYAEDDGGVQRATVTSSGASGYTITYHPGEGDSAVYAARLGRLGDRWVLDVSPGGGAARLADQSGGFLVATHVTFEIEFAGAEIRLGALRGDSVRSALRDGRLRLQYLERPNGDILLTGPSGEIQAALREWMSRDRSEWAVWRRPAGRRP